MASAKPPTDNEGWRRGDGGQWRLDPVAHNRWSFWREGVHFLVGLVTTGTWPGAYLLGVDELLLSTAIVVTAVLFLAYEISEGWRIRDWAYRDIGGFMAGHVFGTFIWIAAAVRWG